MWMDSDDSSEYDDILKELDEELMILYTMMGGREMVFLELHSIGWENTLANLLTTLPQDYVATFH